MLQALRQPKWMIAAVVVVGLALLFIRLGVWQLDRLEHRQAQNAVATDRLQGEVVPFDEALESAVGDLSELEYRRVALSGEFDPTEEVLIRSQVELGSAGFHVITPMVLEDGTAALVNRGWVPLDMDSPPVPAAPGSGVQQVEGWVSLSQNRPALGAEEPEGELGVLNRVDIDRIAQQMPYELAPVYVVAMGESSQLPAVVDPPDLTDDGPHLAYAIQWFGFAVVGLVGFYFLLRRKGSAKT
jgi:surfeit locus 1 family protein